LRVTWLVTVKFSLAVFVWLSVSVTRWFPATAAGTVNEQVKSPVAFDEALVQNVPEPLGAQVPVIAEVAAKPWPVTVTVVPTGPLEGDSEIVEMTVNEALALLEEASLAATVWAPMTAGGTVKVQVNAPALEVVIEPCVQVTVAVSKVSVMLEDPAKPVPLTVTELPTAPLAAERLIDGTTLNVAAAEFVEASVPVTVWLP
jgi:hypothetical protein